MSERSDWQSIRDRRMSEDGAVEAYEATRFAFELGSAVRGLREQIGWTQKQLARSAGMTQSAVARLEAGGTTPTLPVLNRIALALEADLTVQMGPRASESPPLPMHSRVQHFEVKPPSNHQAAGAIQSGRSSQVTFRLSQDLRHRAEARAVRDGLTVSEVAREALVQYLV